MKINKPTATLKPNISKDAPIIFVAGGASAVGSAAIQFAALSGFRVISSSSPKNFDLVKSFGASDVFDYKDPDLVKHVQNAAKKPISYIYDSIGDPQALSSLFSILNGQGEFLSVQTVTTKPEGIKVYHVFASSFFCR